MLLREADWLDNLVIQEVNLVIQEVKYCKEDTKMEICSIKSVQRAVNFTLDDGKMLEVEHRDEIPGVTMVCELPLLFRNGFPTCVENLTVHQLEKFIPYMIRCSGVPPQTKPKWWPDEISFSAKLAKTSGMTDRNWLTYLKRLVSHCYAYHGCEYALTLCSDPTHKCLSLKRTSEFVLENTPLCKVARGTTARSANVCFNEGNIFKRRSPSHNLHRRNASNRNKSPEQIFLCDNCDSEFKSSEEIRAHEKICIENICKSPRAVNIRKSIQNRNTLRTNNAPSVHDLSTGANTESSKIQAAKKILPCNNTLISGTPNSMSKIISQAREPCKNCGKLFVSSKLLRDHETMCLKQQLLLARFLSASANTISRPNIRRDQFHSHRNLSNTNVSPEAKTNSPTRKKRMNLLPHKPSQVNKCKDFSQNDIFLCDIPNKEFTPFADVQAHEALECVVGKELIESSVVAEDEKEFTEANFLRYFALLPASQSQPTSPQISRSVSRSKRYLGNPLRFSGIPVSSVLGSLIHGSHVPPAAILSKMEKVERYCPANPISVFQSEAKNDNGEWRVSYKPRKTTTDYALHLYNFPLKRWWKMPTLWNAQMKVKARNNKVQSLCKSVQIKLCKLTTRDIELYTACRTLRPTVRKLTMEEIRLYTKQSADSRKLKRLSSQERKTHKS